MVDIDLTVGAEQRRYLVNELRSRVNRPDSTKHFGLYFVASHSDFAPLARFVERSVFLRQFGNDDEEMDREYGPFEASSFFILAVDHHQSEPIGAIRIIEQSVAGLKTLADIEMEAAWGTSPDQFVSQHCGTDDPDRVIDVATLAVRSEWSATATGMLTAAALYGGIYRVTYAVRSRQVVSALDESVADLLRSVHIPLDPICDLPAIEYLGSPATRPYVIQVGEAESVMRTNETLLGVLMGGIVDKQYSLPPIDLDNPNPHPIEMEPQFLDSEPAVQPAAAKSLVD